MIAETNICQFLGQVVSNLGGNIDIWFCRQLLLNTGKQLYKQIPTSIHVNKTRIIRPLHQCWQQLYQRLVQSSFQILAHSISKILVNFENWAAYELAKEAEYIKQSSLQTYYPQFLIQTVLNSIVQ